jgi:hypothetical protein
MRLAQSREQHIDRQRTGVRVRPGGAEATVCPGDQLPFVREQDARYAHQKDDDAGRDAGNQVGPENERPKLHRAVNSPANTRRPNG